MNEKKLRSKLRYFFWILLFICLSLITGIWVYGMNA